MKKQGNLVLVGRLRWRMVVTHVAGDATPIGAVVESVHALPRVADHRWLLSERGDAVLAIDIALQVLPIWAPGTISQAHRTPHATGAREPKHWNGM